MNIINLIKSYVNNEQLNIDINDEELKLLLEQSLQTLVYPITQNKLYKKYYITWVLKQEQFFNIQDELTSIFNSNGIDHIYFKGSILAKLYDDPSVRTRGDIDLYVKPSDLDKVKRLLLDNAFEFDDILEDSMHHLGFKKNNIEIEVHFNMFDSSCNSKWRSIFKNPFECAVNIDKNLFQFDDTYHFLYCVMHFGHHLLHGAGVRYLLDFYYMLLKTNIDMNLLLNKINECDLYVLYSNIINSIRKVFDKDFDSRIETKDVQFFIDYLLKYGIHGHANNETTMVASGHKSKFKYLMTKLFLLDKNYKKSKYPKLGHWYFMPICLIVHWIYLLTHKFKSGFKFLFGKNKNKKLYKELGI